jgi:hypothetical protein
MVSLSRRVSRLSNAYRAISEMEITSRTPSGQNSLFAVSFVILDLLNETEMLRPDNNVRDRNRLEFLCLAQGPDGQTSGSVYVPPPWLTFDNARHGGTAGTAAQRLRLQLGAVTDPPWHVSCPDYSTTTPRNRAYGGPSLAYCSPGAHMPRQ